MKTVATIISKKNNNLNIVRFIAACLVIISHASPLSLGGQCVDFLSRLTNGRLGLGGLAVGVFFFSSGLLVSKSLAKNNNAKKYFFARVKRIFPSLMVVVLLSVVILGPLFSKYSFIEYITNIETYKYLLNGFLIPVHNLPGVFESNIYGPVVNGALWTLPVEFLCYIGVFLVYKLKLFDKDKAKILLILMAIIFIVVNYIVLQQIAAVIQPILMFGVGVMYYIYRDNIAIDYKYGFVALLLFVGLLFTPFALLGQLIFFPYVFITLIMATKQCATSLANLGNMSYEIYLLGFPVQQVLVSLNNGSMNIYINAILAIVISVFMGFILSKTIEKYCH